ncbi:MAG: GNAT family N-acetyltransferase [Rhodospirillales bacterium]
MTVRPAAAARSEASAAAVVRDAAERDLPAIQAIYAHHVLTGVGSFEETPPDLAEIAKRFRAVAGAGLPYLAAELDGRVVGYAYAAPFRPRPAYRHTVENSVYVAPGFEGRGVGRALLVELIERCTALGKRQMVAVIGGGYGNAGSARLHQALGFKEAALLKSVGHKFGRWLDSLMMQRPLGPGDSAPPGA